MNKHNFVLAPWGNGIDTHRFGNFIQWFYSNYNKTHFVPIISKYTKNTIKNYSEITKNFLSENLYLLEQNKNNYSFAELDFKYWKNKIKLNEIDARRIIQF